MNSATPADIRGFLTAQQQAQPEHLLSYFNPPITNTRPAKTVELAELWDEITSEQHRPLTERLRTTTDPTERKKLKAGLPFVTPVGCFNYPRRDADLIAPSGLVVLDFDKVPSVREARAALPADEVIGDDVMLMFTSPTGNGVKAFLRTDPDGDYLTNFRIYADYLSSKYPVLGLVADESGKNLARLCFIPYDPTAYLHPSYTSAWITQ
ncbi:BT4734/BF3469 family protein [Hymenobacter arizonensis]|uniref:VirE N-terminal domain-containing protein n=1 Tax=Hymenobacter arizonensis TaxID=1227077 RepID=A0A1I5Z1Z8_HYMAR|nr:BT4734/BF3469 family protein [Hymenobacter arizonensis]SFQ50459.1 VirE N-terminal domain-containing protein [Hymenobacter arizonensis]